MRPRPNAPPRIFFSETQDALILGILEQVGDIDDTQRLAHSLGVSARKLSALYRSRQGIAARSKATPASRAQYKSHLDDDTRTSWHSSVSETQAFSEGLGVTDRPDRKLSEVGPLQNVPLTDIQRELILQVLELLGKDATVSGLARYASALESKVRFFLETTEARHALSKATRQTRKAYSGLLSESHTMTHKLYPEDLQ